MVRITTKLISSRIYNHWTIYYLICLFPISNFILFILSILIPQHATKIMTIPTIFLFALLPIIDHLTKGSFQIRLNSQITTLNTLTQQIDLKKRETNWKKKNAFFITNQHCMSLVVCNSLYFSSHCIS
jgi:hypothetical protein